MNALKYLLTSYCLILGTVCVANDVCPPATGIEEVNQKVEVLSDVPKQQLEETCVSEADNEFSKYFSTTDKIIRKKFGKLKLKGTREQFKILVNILGKKPHSSWPAVATGCDTVLCALTKLFGSEESAKRVLVVAKRDGYVISVDRSRSAPNRPDEQIWALNEIRAIDQSFSVLPQKFKRLKLMKYIYRIPDGLRRIKHDKAVAAFAVSGISIFDIVEHGYIGFYESAFSKSEFYGENWPRTVALHELCHHMDYQGTYRALGRDLSKQHKFGFAALSWQQKAWKWSIKPNAKGFVTDYARTSPAEDFAESCMFYVFYPEILKEKTPEKYALLKDKLFDGLEFIDAPPFSLASSPELDTAVASETFCKDTYANCLRLAKKDNEKNRIQFETARRGNATSYLLYDTAEDFFDKNSCMLNSTKTTSEKLAEDILSEKATCRIGSGPILDAGVTRKIRNSCRSKIGALIESTRQRPRD